MIDVLLAILGILLIFFLPGFFLVLILFPQKGALHEEFDLVFKAVMGIALSILISILLGIVLDAIGVLAAPEGGYAVWLWLSQIIVTVSLAIISWRLGGLKNLIADIRSKEKKAKVTTEEELQQLAHRKNDLQAKLAILKSKEYEYDDALRAEAGVKIPAIEKEIGEINKRIDEIAVMESAKQYLESDADETAR